MCYQVIVGLCQVPNSAADMFMLSGAFWFMSGSKQCSRHAFFLSGPFRFISGSKECSRHKPTST